MKIFGAFHKENKSFTFFEISKNKTFWAFLIFSESSHPISIPVNNPDEINEIFDTISYSKGSSIIRMMANFIQLETFTRGINNYLQAKAYGNANQDRRRSKVFASKVDIQTEILIVRRKLLKNQRTEFSKKNRDMD